ncbi:inorganic phosphate transporter, partial [Streptomyces sp. SID7760]|nr:inorganic phosphate transporter [Streptomyces sp. SID7760]
VMRTGDVGVAAVALFLIASCVAIWLISRRQVVDHSNVNDVQAAEEPGVVTTAMAAVTVPPTVAAEAAAEAVAGTTAAVTDEALKATIPAAAPTAPAAPAAAV